MQCKCGGVTRDHTYTLKNGDVVDVKTCCACGREQRKVTNSESMSVGVELTRAFLDNINLRD